MKRCTKCILPETFPSIKFDSTGVCNYCNNYRGPERQEILKSEYSIKFKSLITDLITSIGRQAPKNNSYNVLMAYSGGKDSTYTLDIFKNHYKLNVLALTFDNGFISPFAINNIKHVCDQLGVDHITYKTQFNTLKKIFAASISTNIFSKKTIERASTICSACMGIVKFITLKMALEKNIPFIGYGWSPGQAPVQSSVMKINEQFIHSSQKSLLEPLQKIAGDVILPYFLNESDFNKLSTNNFYNIHPLAFLNYNEEQIYQRIKQLGWKSPKDTDSNSSNCLLNSFANQTHLDKYGFHPYVFEIAGLVRSGVLSRNEGIQKIEEPQNLTTINQVKTKLGI